MTRLLFGARVRRRLLISVAVASSAVAAAIFLLPPAASAVNTQLFAYTSEPDEPYHGIWLKDANGVLVTHLDPGTYEIEVDDRSAMSSFHLNGPGVDVATRIEEIGHTTWTVTFTAGTYRYYCDFLPGVMNGSFTVGTPSPPTPPRPSPPASPCNVPNVKGKTLGAAGLTLTKTHCRVGTISRAYSTAVKKSHVISQKPAPGTRLSNHGKVSLVISRGRKP